MLRVEGALASVQGTLGVIPAEAAAFLHQSNDTVQIDAAELTAETAINCLSMPALLVAFRRATDASEHTAWLHWGSTRQNIMNTALALRLKPQLDIWEARLDQIIAGIGQLADRHADLPMAARTFWAGRDADQLWRGGRKLGATAAAPTRPTGCKRAEVLQVSLSGAAGSYSAGGVGTGIGASRSGASRHSERDGIAAFAGCMAVLTASLCKIGADLVLLAESGIAEVVVAGAGASSTMAQKQNPVAESLQVALARQSTGLAATMQVAVVHGQQREGAAWFTEWLTSPQLCISTGQALSLAADVAAPHHARSRRHGSGAGTRRRCYSCRGDDLCPARILPRPEASAAITALVAEALAQKRDLTAVGRRAGRGWTSACR
jgi:3-carboxy-cis,cis-muconate cycloisomerase